jgi:hypothetical protein
MIQPVNLLSQCLQLLKRILSNVVIVQGISFV